MQIIEEMLLQKLVITTNKLLKQLLLDVYGPLLQCTVFYKVTRRIHSEASEKYYYYLGQNN